MSKTWWHNLHYTHIGVCNSILYKNCINKKPSECMLSYDIFTIPWWIWNKMNSLAPGRCGSIFVSLIFKLILQNNSQIICSETALMCMPQNLTNESSTLVQVVALCHQVRNYYPSQCWPRFMWPFWVTRPQWVEPNYQNQSDVEL